MPKGLPSASYSSSERSEEKPKYVRQNQLKNSSCNRTPICIARVALLPPLQPASRQLLTSRLRRVLTATHLCTPNGSECTSCPSLTYGHRQAEATRKKAVLSVTRDGRAKNSAVGPQMHCKMELWCNTALCSAAAPPSHKAGRLGWTKTHAVTRAHRAVPAEETERFLTFASLNRWKYMAVANARMIFKVS